MGEDFGVLGHMQYNKKVKLGHIQLLEVGIVMFEKLRDMLEQNILTMCMRKGSILLHYQIGL